MKRVYLVLTIIIAIISIIGSVFLIDARFAKAIRVKFVELRLDQKIVQDRAMGIQEQIYQIEDRFRTIEDKKTQVDIDKERRLRKDLDEAEDQLKRIKDSQKETRGNY